jgi:hypothetical protein
MVREPTSRPMDSGWCFMSGDESQEYMDDDSNHAIYDVNTIANYSPDITPFSALSHVVHLLAIRTPANLFRSPMKSRVSSPSCGASNVRTQKLKGVR